MAEDKNKLKEEQLQDEQLEELSCGGKIPHSTARDF